MCYSPETSFAGAAVIGAFGIAALKLAGKNKRLLLVALMPIFFAIQQASEGFVWLGLQGRITSPEIQNFAKNMYIFFAYGVWPIYVPISLYIVEDVPWRKKVLLGIGIFGAVVAATIFANVSLSEIHPKIEYHHIRYINEPTFIYKLGYLITVTIPFFLSSLTNTWIFGFLVSVAFFITLYVSFETFTSIWCFFGAIFSIAIYWVIREAVKTPRLQK
jgi:hypothetical protein